MWDNAANKQFRALIRNPRLAVRRYVPSPDYLLALTQKLQPTTAKYHLERVVVRVTDILRGTQRTVISNLHMGQLPKQMFVGFVNSNDFYGTKGRNPSNFQHYNV